MHNVAITISTPGVEPMTWGIECTPDQLVRLEDKVRVAVDSVRGELELDF